jgi:hypothetical protein
MPVHYALRLREELSLRALAWAEGQNLPHEQTLGRSPSVIFRASEQGTHGNFFQPPIAASAPGRSGVAAC